MVPSLSDLSGRVSRRGLLIGGGAGIGLLVAWAAWPRRYAPNLVAAPGETIISAWIKIGEDGHVTVVVPQAEMGQGVTTSLPQIVADELGADWRTIAVEAAPLNPLYANRLLATGMAAALAPALTGSAAGYAERSGLMATAGSTSLRAFERPLRDAGATARVLLAKAAAARWGIAWETCDTKDGFVVAEERRLRFGELAVEAAGYTAPSPPPWRAEGPDRLSGQSPLRLDLPGKIDGSATFAADIRLPRMVYAAIRQGPIGGSRLVRVDKAAAERVAGMRSVVTTDHWVAAVASNWWAANRALDAMAPRFETPKPLIDDAAIDAALAAALNGDGHRIAGQGELAEAFRGQTIRVADYVVGVGQHASPETPAATANWDRDLLEIWLPTQAPAVARRVAAAAIGVAETQVVVHPMLIGGGFGRALDHEVAAQVAVLARRLDRPVQLMWSRAEEMMHDRFRAPARARMAARTDPAGRVLGWQAKIATPAWGQELADRLLAGETLAGAAFAAARGGDGLAVAGAVPPYRIPALAVDYHPAEIDLPTGYWRSGGDFVSAFATESFIDELAQAAGIDPFSCRMAMLAGQPRLARCLSTATALGGWQGGGAGTGQGIACHASRGSFVAVLAEARLDGDRVRVDRLVAVADLGRMIHPDIVRQQIEGGLLFGMAAAVAAPVSIAAGLAGPRRLGDLRLPRLADSPEVTVELVASKAEPGGASEVAVPPVAPAIANALFAATGRRFRTLPFTTAA
ncbi:xanthine dehydrogenase family protein molybdopterin-binding subunit [Sphingomonas flavalba]|uniref:xanthine dehydrogenase family protein molybdopterin-binding subunit n=1 Tax=Sphingomonas flavalba TaxID=2559804 RepID=UPI0019D0F359|nr:molybdopterin cofactor-binding domain-containing protein [Sphingomonas flavalba]